MKWLTHIYVFMIVLAATPAFSQDHTHADEAVDGPAEEGVFTVYAESQRYELTLKHEELIPGQESELTLYIADYATNRPLDDVELKLSVQEDPQIVVTGEETSPGVYHIHGVFPEKRPYALAVNLNSPGKGADLLLLSPVEVGKAPPVASEAAGDDHEHSDWWKYALVFAAGMGIALFFFRRRPKAAVSILLVVFIHSFLQDAGAHGGHDEEETKSGTSVVIPKATQFLFEILTQQIRPGSFHPSVEFYGTVVPSPGGFATVTTPLTGKVMSLRVSPGDKVQAGQQLAVINPSISQSERVGIAAETGRLQAELKTAKAELDAAERDLRRLREISDIIARKELEAAEARYAAAKANYESLRATTGGAAISSGGNLVITAPVAGTVGQFILAPGAEVISGTSLFSITNLEKVYVEAQVYDRDADVVKNASKYTVTCTNDDEHKTAEVRIVSAALEVNPTNQSQKVLFEVLNPEGEFKIGEFVTLQAFHEGAETRIFVPNSSLSEINGRPVLFVKNNPELYEIHYVSIGEDNGTHTVIQKGIEEGNRYVTEGTYQVKMMMLNQ